MWRVSLHKVKFDLRARSFSSNLPTTTGTPKNRERGKSRLHRSLHLALASERQRPQRARHSPITPHPRPFHGAWVHSDDGHGQNLNNQPPRGMPSNNTPAPSFSSNDSYSAYNTMWDKQCPPWNRYPSASTQPPCCPSHVGYHPSCSPSHSPSRGTAETSPTQSPSRTEAHTKGSGDAILPRIPRS